MIRASSMFAGVVFVLFSLCLSAFADTVGTLKVIDATKGVPSTPIDAQPGDIIKITIPIANVNDIPTSSVLTGTSVGKIGLVIQEQTTYSVFLVAQRLGSSDVSFVYVPKGTAQPISLKFTIMVTTTRPGRVIEVSPQNQLTDVTTGKPPVGGVLIGDLVRYNVGTATAFKSVNSSVKGTALVKGSTVNDGGNIFVYFSADTFGVGSFVVSYVTVNGGDGGFISTDITVSP
jgi:hypothetical protein